MALAKSGLSANSAQSFVIDSGVVYKNVTYTTDGGFTGTLLGATTGGVEINIEKKYRKIEVDGAYVMDVKGLNVVESAQATLKATLIELTAENIRLAVNGQATTTSTDYPGYTVIEDRYVVQDDDYIENMAIIGTLTGSTEPIIFLFDNVLITSALNIKMEDQKEAAIEIEGQANATFDQLNQRQSPWRIIYPNTGTEQNAIPVG